MSDERIYEVSILSDAPDGRSKAWRRRPPEVRCTTCGAREFIGLT